MSSVDECISIKGLLAGWQEKQPVCKIDEYRLKHQKITVLCGPNGVGKSTLLKTIAGQIRPLAGEVIIDGSALDQLSSLQIARRLAFVPQFAETRRSLLVEEWVALGRNPHQQWWSWAASAADNQKIEYALTRTKCDSLRAKTMDTLSGGERQRVLIATALAQEPAYMLLDEPTAHLDFKHQLELLDLLKNLRNEGLGILIVLHDLNLAARIADDILLLKLCSEGPSEVAAAGDVETVFSPEILRSVYGVEMEILASSDGNKTYLARSLSPS